MALSDYRINRQQWAIRNRKDSHQAHWSANVFLKQGDFALTVELRNYERVNVIQAGIEMQPGKVHTAVHNILIREKSRCKSRWKQVYKPV